MTEAAPSPHCCAEFAAKIGDSPGAFVHESDGAWYVEGCCGGGCYVISDMRFCPYCGQSLREPPPLPVL